MGELNVDELMKRRKQIQNKRWNEANKAHKSEYNKRYYEANKEKIFAQRKADTAPAPKREKRIKPHKGLPVQTIPTKFGNY